MFTPDLNSDYYSNPPHSSSFLEASIELDSIFYLTTRNNIEWNWLTPAAQRSFYYMSTEIEKLQMLPSSSAFAIIAFLLEENTALSVLLSELEVDQHEFYESLASRLTASLLDKENAVAGVFDYGVLQLSAYIPVATEGISTLNFFVAYMLHVWLRNERIIGCSRDNVSKSFFIENNMHLERVLEVTHALEAERKLTPDAESIRPAFGVRKVFRQIEASEISCIGIDVITKHIEIENTETIMLLLSALRNATCRGTMYQNGIHTVKVFFKHTKDFFGNYYHDKFEDWSRYADGYNVYLEFSFNMHNALDAFGYRFHEIVRGLIRPE